jgi:hypothetical protein
MAGASVGASNTGFRGWDNIQGIVQGGHNLISENLQRTICACSQIASTSRSAPVQSAFKRVTAHAATPQQIGGQSNLQLKSWLHVSARKRKLCRRLRQLFGEGRHF